MAGKTNELAGWCEEAAFFVQPLTEWTAEIFFAGYPRAASAAAIRVRI